jgi:uncharacterized protein with von Willebrand factor type A (vWA) domain
MFEPLLWNLRDQGLSVGLGEWRAFLTALERGLAGSVDELYHVGRSILVHSEAHYDLYDVAFARTFAGLVSDPRLVKALEAWLKDPKAFDEARAAGQHDFRTIDELLEAMKKTMEQQHERHEGGNRWVGTGGTSPWGTGGRANQGVQLGEHGGGRSGVRLAEDRLWQNYRTDRILDVRDFAVALRALRQLAREGEEVLDLDETIDATAHNDGDIDLVFRRARTNRVRVALFMDSGGSMFPHAELVSRLFSAAKDAKGFKTFDHYYFHNCIYQHLWTDYEGGERVTSGRCWSSSRPSIASSSWATPRWRRGSCSPSRPRWACRRPRASTGCRCSTRSARPACGSTRTPRSSGTTPRCRPSGRPSRCSR